MFLTSEGKKKLENELRELLAKRPILSKRIEAAKELGDLSENAEYHDAKDEQGMVEGHIRKLEEMLKHAKIMERPADSETVTIGSKIIVEVKSKERAFEIVGLNEANPASGKISDESPLGKALLGRKIGDSAEAQTPSGRIIYKIKAIE